ncbi:hypothetical protein PENTCL1PPCAC_12803, partial [Pristionchus entomophagus]
ELVRHGAFKQKIEPVCKSIPGRNEGGFFAKLPAGNEVHIQFILKNDSVFTHCHAPAHPDWGPEWLFALSLFGPMVLCCVCIPLGIGVCLCVKRRRERTPLIYQQPHPNLNSATSAANQPDVE